jgi:hypothetical protein
MFALLIPILPFAVVGLVMSFFTKDPTLALLLRIASGLVIVATAVLVLLFIHLARTDPHF